MRKFLLSFLSASLLSLTGWAQYSCINWPYQISSVTVNSSTSVTLNLITANSLVSNPPSFRVGTLFTSVGGSSDLGGTFSQAASNKASITLNGLLPGGSYTFYAQTDITCANFNSYGEVSQSFSDDVQLNYSVVVMPPSAPASPTVLATSSSSATFSWTGVAGAGVTYKLDYATNSTFTAGLQTISGIPGLSQAVSGLTNGGTYYYRVSAQNAGGSSAPTVAGSTLVLPPVPTASAATSITTSSFTANWPAVSGATGYQLDVSADNFTSTLTNYSNLPVTGTSKSVTGLSAGTAYKYRIRVVNAVGTSSSSLAINVLTLPAAPVLKSPDNITISGLRLNWNAVASATGYQVDLSSASDFSNPVSASNISISGTSATITGLSSGTAYNYRVRAVNGTGLSANSTVASQITVSDPPVLSAPSNVTNSSFTLSWSASTGAASYQLDVSADGFTTFVSGYQNLAVAGTIQAVTSLAAGTSYSFRVRAVNAGGTSSNSTVASQYTLPAAPANFNTTDFTATSMKASWNAVTSAIEYHLEVSSKQDFSELVANYGPKIISSQLTEDVVTGLLPSTVYYLRVRAKNQVGFSDPSSIKVSNTLSGSGGNDFTIQLTESASNTDAHTTGQTQNLSVSATGGAGALTAYLFHRKNSTTDFTSELMTATSGNYSIPLDDSWFDSFGMEYYFQFSDVGGQVKQSGHHSIPVSVPNVTVPVSSFGGEIKNYQIISFPYTFSNNQINNVMEKVMGAYDKKKWRFSQYRNGKIVDYQEGLAVSNFTQGQSYFFISKNQVDLSVGAGKTFNNSLANPFILPLKKGWNQVGNPFPYAVSWQQVLTDNGSPAGVGNLYTFSQSSVSFVEKDQLDVYGGGFVFADNDIDLVFRVTLPVSSGRIITGKSSDISTRDSWQVPITLVQGDTESQEGGIGMDAEARDGKDRFDRVALPKVLRYLQMNATAPGCEFELSRSIVTKRNHYTWNFLVQSDVETAVTLRWNQQDVIACGSHLILHDLQSNQLLDMAKVSEHTVRPSTPIAIYYDATLRFDQREVTLGAPYPNPFLDQVTIPFGFSNDESASEVLLTVYNMEGKEVAQVKGESTEQGLQSITWNGHNQEGVPLPAGLYVYHLIENKTNGIVITKGKLIKQ